jgi:hypothetical protein
MNRHLLSTLLAVAAAIALAYPGFAAKPVPSLTPAGSYSNSYKNAKNKARDFAEIISVSAATKRAAITIPVEPGDVATPGRSFGICSGD